MKHTRHPKIRVVGSKYAKEFSDDRIASSELRRRLVYEACAFGDPEPPFIPTSEALRMKKSRSKKVSKSSHFVEKSALLRTMRTSL